MISSSQVPARYRTVIDDQVKVYVSGRSIQQVSHIPDTPDIPITNPRHWLKIPNVICVFADMLGSTRLSAGAHDKSTAGAFQLFTGTAVRLFNEFESPYIDVSGDGAFALFDSDQPHRALAAAVTFKTFAAEEFVPRISKDTGVDVGCHIGIDQKTVLVRRLGFKRYRGRTDRQNEVWAGKPVNMAAKLASLTKNNELLVSDRYYGHLKAEQAKYSCGCPNGTKVLLWGSLDISHDDIFDFDVAYRLSSNWCQRHGSDYCAALVDFDP